jgi:hypothetical protein
VFAGAVSIFSSAKHDECFADFFRYIFFHKKILLLMKTNNLHSIFILALVSFTLSYSQVNAQSVGTNQLGLRLGGYSGITFRHIGASDVGVQIDLLENYHGYWTLFDAMAEKHIPLNKGFVFYLGGGAFIGGYHDPFYDRDVDPYWDAALGLQGVLGFDYYFENVPLNLGIDLTPRFSFFHSPSPWDAGISLRYIF